MKLADLQAELAACKRRLDERVRMRGAINLQLAKASNVDALEDQAADAELEADEATAGAALGERPRADAERASAKLQSARAALEEAGAVQRELAKRVAVADAEVAKEARATANHQIALLKIIHSREVGELQGCARQLIAKLVRLRGLAHAAERAGRAVAPNPQTYTSQPIPYDGRAGWFGVREIFDEAGLEVLELRSRAAPPPSLEALIAMDLSALEEPASEDEGPRAA
jgi:hypothetical protein